MKDAIEGWLDATIGRPGRKFLEQVAHAIMAGIPAFLVVNWLPSGLSWQIPTAIVFALFVGGIREYFQNIGDEPDEDTLFQVGDLPVNGDMLLDMGAYGCGGMLAGFLGFAL